MMEKANCRSSYWEATLADPPSYPPLSRDLDVNVVIVGAGIVGLSAAERLCAEGKSVVVLDALRVASQVTARSTAKVTSQHGLRYKRLIDEVGEDHARLYAQVNEAAIGEIEQLIAKEGIRCGFERKPAYLYTTDAAEASEIESGATVTARDVVVATHQPIVPDGKFFAKAFPFSHSVVAAPVEASRAPGGMCVTSGEPSFSFRDDASGDQRYLIAVGPTFRTGVTEEEADSFRQLEQFVRETFGIETPAYRWTNEDFAPMDGLPFIGRATSDAPHFFVALGFNAWGITLGVTAAALIADLILDRSNPCEELFDARRIRPLKGGAEFLKGNAQSAKHFVGDRLGIPDKAARDLTPGQAMITRVDGEKAVAYRDDEGRVHAVSAVCTHMGCVVGWNQTDKSWDCPCHGSRFDTDGKVLHGPATTPLKKMTEV